MSEKIKIGNLGTDISQDDLTEFFKFTGVIFELGVDGDQNFAIATVPSSHLVDFKKFDGVELRGRKIAFLPEDVSEGDSVSTNIELPTAAPPKVGGPEIVQLDFSHARDVYQYKKLSVAEVVMAVRHTFGDDDTRRLIAPRRKDDTLWLIETDNIDQYKGVDMVKDGGENEVASVEIKETVVVTSSDGVESRVKYVRTGLKQDGDLLLTLVHADTGQFRHISNDEITRLVVDLGIGRIKKGVQMQPIRGTHEPSGNKFLVLENVKDEDKKKIPPSFDFPRLQGRGGRMWINFFGKPRRCYFCNEFHDEPAGVCPIEATVRNMEMERAGTDRKIKTYSDSTLRLVRQSALTSDVDAMSGGTTGNLLNAVEIDESSENVENVVIVAGQNELHRRMTNAEFLWMDRSKEERLTKLAEKKKIAVISPPTQEFLDPVSQAREEIARASLTRLRDAGSILLWDNPVPAFDDDFGRHPSAVQTKTIINLIDKNCREVFGVPFVLDSATDEVLTTKLYTGVNSLYKFGCSGCNGRTKNKWYNLCNDCTSSLGSDEKIMADTEKLVERAEAIYDELNPAFIPADGSDMEIDGDSLVCPACGVSFNDGNEIRNHFDTQHEGTVLVVPGDKEKRKKNKATDHSDGRANKVHKNN